MGGVAADGGEDRVEPLVAIGIGVGVLAGFAIGPREHADRFDAELGVPLDAPEDRRDAGRVAGQDHTLPVPAAIPGRAPNHAPAEQHHERRGHPADGKRRNSRWRSRGRRDDQQQGPGPGGGDHHRAPDLLRERVIEVAFEGVVEVGGLHQRHEQRHRDQHRGELDRLHGAAARRAVEGGHRHAAGGDREQIGGEHQPAQPAPALVRAQGLDRRRIGRETARRLENPADISARRPGGGAALPHIRSAVISHLKREPDLPRPRQPSPQSDHSPREPGSRQVAAVLPAGRPPRRSALA